MKQLWALRDVRVYLVGQAFSILGDSALWLAAGIWVKVLTGSNAAAGLTFFFLVLPTLASPLAGFLVDRVRRRPLLILTNTATGLAVLLLLFVRDAQQVWLIWVVMVIYGSSNTVTSSAQSAFVTVIVPAPLLGEANGVLRTIREGLRIITPLIGAGLFAAVGGGAVAVLDAGTFAIAVASLLLVRVHEPSPEAPTESWTMQFTAGFRHVWATPDLRRTMLACACALLVFGFFETIGFALVSQGLHEPAPFFGVVVAVQGVGAIGGGLSAAPAMGKLGEIRLTALGLLGVAAGAALWQIPHLVPVFAGSLVAGFALPWMIVGAYTLIQRRTPTRLQGRTYSAFDMVVSTPQTISIGIGAAVIGIIPYSWLLAAISLVSTVAGLTLLKNPRAEPPPWSPTPRLKGAP